MMTFGDVAALAANPLAYAEGRTYAAIVGAQVSTGARSPALWNAAFKAHGVDAEMLPIDIPVERLSALLDALEADSSFVGGAIAAPYKELTSQWLGGRVTTEALHIGAVNCLFRDSAGRLAGTNTDGEGALVSFQARFGPVVGKSVLLLGPGGAGKAVAAFFRGAVEPNGRLCLAGRSEQGRRYAERLDCRWVEWRNLPMAMPDADVLINCTSIGSGASAGESPVAGEALAALPDGAPVFDIIYDPSPSPLLTVAARRHLPVFDGAAMNLEQAVLAYGYAAPQSGGPHTTRVAMEQARR